MRSIVFLDKPPGPGSGPPSPPLPPSFSVSPRLAPPLSPPPPCFSTCIFIIHSRVPDVNAFQAKDKETTVPRGEQCVQGSSERRHS